MIGLYVTLSFVALIALIAIVAVIVNKSNKKKHGDFDHHKGTYSPVGKSITEVRGRQGEEYVFNYLEKYVIGPDDTLLPTLLLKTYNGNQTEVDLVILSLKGIFCIEVKNWVGQIKGDDFSDKWIQIYDDDYTPNKSHRNPVHQNENHCEILRNLLGNRYNINNIVLFKELEYTRSIHSEKVFDLKSFEEYFFSLRSDVLTNEDLDDIYETLKQFEASEEELRRYRQQVKNKYNNK